MCYLLSKNAFYIVATTIDLCQTKGNIRFFQEIFYREKAICINKFLWVIGLLLPRRLMNLVMGYLIDIIVAFD